MYHENMSDVIDLGHGHYLWYNSFTPDRDINPQYKGVPDVEKIGASIEHVKPDGKTPCVGGLFFRSPIQEKYFPEHAAWDVISWDPLHIEPSVLCSCGDHGFIRNGRWEPC